MEKAMTDLAQVEQELSELATQLKQSFKVLDGLAQIQGRFEELAQTHQRFRESLEKNNTTLEKLNQLQQVIDRRFTTLETEMASKVEGVGSQVSHIQSEMSTAERNFSAELAQQINSLRREMETRLSTVAKEWEHQREILQAPMEEFESRVRAEVKAAVNWVAQSGANANQVETLDAQVRSTRSSLQTMEKQLRSMRQWLVFTVLLIVLLALGLPVTLLISQATNRASNRPPIINPERIDPGQPGTP